MNKNYLELLANWAMSGGRDDVKSVIEVTVVDIVYATESRVVSKSNPVTSVDPNTGNVSVGVSTSSERVDVDNIYVIYKGEDSKHEMVRISLAQSYDFCIGQVVRISVTHGEYVKEFEPITKCKGNQDETQR